MSDRKQYLLDHVRKEPGPLGDDCWIWTASLSHGYGQTYWNGVIGRAHRMSYEEFHGSIPPRCQINHKCDRKDCINPKHLKLGNSATNNADKFSRGEPELTRQEFDRLSAELADLDRKAVVSDRRREQIEAQLRRTIRDNRQEFNSIAKDHRDAKRQQRKAAAEERERLVEERHTRLNPEALAKLRSSIALLKEATPEALSLRKEMQANPARRDLLRNLINNANLGKGNGEAS